MGVSDATHAPDLAEDNALSRGNAGFHEGVGVAVGADRCQCPVCEKEGSVRGSMMRASSLGYP
jgi:hypothetical protein